MKYKYKFLTENKFYNQEQLSLLNIYAYDKEYEEKSDKYFFYLEKSKISKENLYLIFDGYCNYVGEMGNDEIYITEDFLDQDEDGFQYESLHMLDNFNKEKFIEILSKCIKKLRIQKENMIFK